jgi:hypothetical protein
MTKKYFEPIDLDIHIPEEQKVEKPKDPLERDMQDIYGKIQKEINNLQIGRSQFAKYAIYFPKGVSPVLEGFKRMRENPDTGTVLNFLQLAKQDLGAAAANYFTDLFMEIDPNIRRKLGDE